MGAAMPLIVSETLTRSSGIPANASSMSASESTAIPTRPTSPLARGWSESSPSWVGRSKATLSASCPWAIRYLKRALVCAGVPKPTYWRIVQSRSRYMRGWMPRVYGYSPGWPMSRAASRPARSSGPYTGLTGMPACSVMSLMPISSRDVLEGLHDLRKRRTHREHAAHAEGQQRLDVLRGDGPADHDVDVGGALRAQSFQDTAGERQVRAREDRQPHHVHVFLNRFLHDLLGGALEPRVHHLDTGVAQRLRDHLGPAVVAVEAGLRDEHLHDATAGRPGSSATMWPVTRPAAIVRRPTATGRRNRRGPALPGLK